jgi:hypothetical protein
VGDIVEIDRLGRRFHALVTGQAPDGLALNRSTGESPTEPAAPAKYTPTGKLELDTTSRHPD